MTGSLPRWLRRYAFALPILAFSLGLAAPAEAGVVARISLSSQRMEVFVDGSPRYSWPVSTARRGYHTPVGTFRPQALAVWHRSTIYSGSPMPHSIFFHGGYAVHRSYQTRYLGRPASPGCLPLPPPNAAARYSLGRKYGSGNTVIKITY